MSVSPRCNYWSFYWDDNQDWLGIYFKSKPSFYAWVAGTTKNYGLKPVVVCPELEKIIVKTRKPFKSVNLIKKL